VRVFFNYKSQITNGKLQMFFLKAIASTIQNLRSFPRKTIMRLDIRMPIGMMFTLFGALLLIYGVMTRGSAMYDQHSLKININLWWGLGLLIFGIIMLLLGRSGKATARLAAESAEGRAMEEIEHHKGTQH